MAESEFEFVQSRLRSFVATCGVFLAHGVAVGAVVVQVGLISNHYFNWFEREDMNLPWLTIKLIDLDGALLNPYWYVLFLLLVPDAVVYYVLSRSRQRWNWLAGIWFALPLIAAIVLMATASVAVFLPIAELADPKAFNR